MNRFGDWWNRSSASLAGLVERPWLCASVLLAIHSVSRPYLGLVHDAKLYSLQVASHIWPHAYDADLFFAFGSQDSFSVFSRLMAPLSGALGIELSFLIVWMITTACIVYAEVHLVRRLIDSPALAAVALVLLTLTGAAYGGRQIFRVHEAFLTARLPAVAIVLIAFVQLLDQRYVRAALLLVVAMVIHPLMSVPALCVGGAFIASARWRAERLAVVGGIAAIALALAALVPAVGRPLFGHMDGEWLRITKITCAQCFPSRWSATEWCRTCVALMILIGVRGYLPPLARRLVFWVAFTAVSGLAVNVYAEWTQYAVLIQGQAFRALWLAELLAYPLGVYLVYRLWQEEAAKKWVAIPVAAFAMQPFAYSSLQGEKVLDTIGLWAVSSLCAGGFIYACSRRNGWPASTALAVLTGLLGMSLFQSLARFGSFIIYAKQSTEPISVVWWLGMHVASVALVTVAALVAILLTIQRVGEGWRLASLAAGVWLFVGILPFGLDSSRIGERRLSKEDRDTAFVKDFLASDSPAAGAQLVYWPSDPSRIWLNLRKTSYYSWSQLCGIIFTEDLSDVAASRGELARRFEVDSMRKSGMPESVWETPLQVLGTDFDEPPPTEEDLVRLAEDPALDWIVTERQIGDLAAATNGSVYIYDARKIREPSGVVLRREP